ncbi:hypothetical protein LXL04_017229 [Taraxacum kok-saghyz]
MAYLMRLCSVPNLESALSDRDFEGSDFDFAFGADASNPNRDSLNSFIGSMLSETTTVRLQVDRTGSYNTSFPVRTGPYRNEPTPLVPDTLNLANPVPYRISFPVPYRVSGNYESIQWSNSYIHFR